MVSANGSAQFETASQNLIIFDEKLHGDIDWNKDETERLKKALQEASQQDTTEAQAHQAQITVGVISLKSDIEREARKIDTALAGLATEIDGLSFMGRELS